MTVKSEEESTLRVGVRSKDSTMVQAALADGCDPNETDQQGWTILHDAASSGSSSITLALLRKGAKSDVQDRLLNSPLHVAAKEGHIKIVQILLDNGAKITLQNIDGNTPEDLATSACKELLQRKRIEMLMRGKSIVSPAKIYQDDSLHKLNPKRSSSPKRLQKQAAFGSRESVRSNSGNKGPGEITLTVEYDKRNTWLKINIQEIKDLKLPLDHNYSHLYIKCYLLPDKNKETKGKTKLIRIETPSDEGYSSRGSSASSQSSMASMTSLDSDGSQIADKVMSVLKKRPHLHSKKTKDKVKCKLQSEEGDKIGRLSAAIDEGVWYNGIVLRKYNNIMSECKIHLSVCGRNRWTSNGVVIADVVIPVTVALKKATMLQGYPLNYKIATVSESIGQEKEDQINQSWETKDGCQYTGRSLAWNNNLMSESTGTSEMLKTPSASDISTKKHRKHPSRVSKFLKGDMMLFKGKQNDRYKRNLEAASQEDINNMGEDEVQYIGQDLPQSSVSSQTVMNSQISEHWCKSSDDIFTKQPEVSSPTRPSLKYSRAFGDPPTSIRNSYHSYSQDVTLEDF